MKKIIFSVLTLAFVFSACSLDETPYGQLPENEAYKTPKLVYINAVASLYNEIRTLGGQDRNVYDMNTFSTDEAMLPQRGSDWYDGGLWISLFTHSWTPSTDLLLNAWNGRFTAVGKCNQSIGILENLKKTTPDATYLDEYIAEVRALRALSYFYLLDNFGRVPIVTSPSTPIEDVRQSNRSEVYQFVKNELQEALPLLKSARSPEPGQYYGRMTKATAYFLLAKLAINAKVYTNDNWEAGETGSTGNADFTIGGQNVGAWQAVITYCDLIEQEGYKLSTDYTVNFSVNNESSLENIFVIPMDPTLYRTPNYNLLRTMHYIHGSAWGMSSWNGAAATKTLLTKFGYNTASVDPRLDLCFYTGKVTDPNGNYIKAEDKVTDFEYLPSEIKLIFQVGSEREKRAGARWKKYQIDPLFAGNGEYVHNDYVLFRFSDALLMKAEAQLRLGNQASAIAIVNTVRDRVKAPARTALTLSDLLDERMLELSWEGWRRNDMIRFGTFTQALVNDTEKTQSGAFRTVFPIPQNAVGSNGNLKQNPGY